MSATVQHFRYHLSVNLRGHTVTVKREVAFVDPGMLREVRNPSCFSRAAAAKAVRFKRHIETHLLVQACREYRCDERSCYRLPLWRIERLQIKNAAAACVLGAT